MKPPINTMAQEFAGRPVLAPRRTTAGPAIRPDTSPRRLDLLEWTDIASQNSQQEGDTTMHRPALLPAPEGTSQLAPQAGDQSRNARLEVLAEWDGYVEQICADYFAARMRGLRGAGVAGRDEEAEIPLCDVDAHDRPLVTVGALFRLTVAYEIPKIGARRRYAAVQFRRLAAYSKRELDGAATFAKGMSNGLEPGSHDSAAGCR